MIIVFGPTGVGKTDFSLRLAQNIPSEIINMDMGSFYTPLTIGTAKPDWKNSPITHHLFDRVDTPTNYTVVHYRSDVHRLIGEIKNRGNTPILVGGSGFYLKSLFFVPSAVASSNYTALSDKTDQQLWDELYAVDPVRANQIHKNDRYRVERALTIWYTTGKKASEQAPEYMPIDTRVTIIYITREREELYGRINQRVDEMMNAGWLEEVKKLQGTAWERFLHEKKIIGYDDLLNYLSGSTTLEHAIQSTKTKSRNYAKRQLTFWRMLEKSLSSANTQSAHPIQLTLQTLNLTLDNLELYIKQLTHI